MFPYEYVCPLLKAIYSLNVLGKYVVFNMLSDLYMASTYPTLPSSFKTSLRSTIIINALSGKYNQLRIKLQEYL